MQQTIITELKLVLQELSIGQKMQNSIHSYVLDKWLLQ